MAMQIAALIMTLLVASSLADFRADCPGAVGDNWIVGAGRCFKYFGLKLSFNRAQEYCASMGFAGKLVFLDSQEAITKARLAVVEILGVDKSDHPQWIWTGMVDEGNEDNWRSVDGVKINKDQIDFLDRQPDNAGRREHYLQIRTDVWQLNDVYESYSSPFICQVEPATPDQSRCPQNWQRRGDICYKFLDSALTWAAAQDRCESLGNDGSLVDIPSSEVNDFVTDFAKASGSWIGLEDRCHEDEWSNAYGHRSTYTNFAPGQPDDMRGEDCVQFSPGMKQWNDIGCESLLKFVCQRSAFFSAATAPEGWIRQENNFYKYVRQRTTFLDAATRCQDLVPGAQLASVRDEEDFEQYYTIAAKSAGGECSSEFRNFWAGIAHPAQFRANADQETPVVNMLKTPLTARFIRVQPTKYYGHTSMRLELLSDCKREFGENIRGLGLEDYTIPDYRITASTIWDTNHGATNARLERKKQAGTTGGWSAKVKDLNQWIQVDLGCQQLVSGVVTQGRHSYGQWVKTYKVQYGNDGQQWSFVKDSNGQAVDFNGNFDMDTGVANKFDKPVSAQYIRIVPTTWHGHISMRFEVLGLGKCIGDNPVCTVGLGVENHQITDSQMTASSEVDANHGASNGRLNRPKIIGAASWSAKRNDQYQWLQVDLGGVKAVSGVVTQGRADYSQWVKTFKVQYSLDGTTFNFIKDKNGANAQFTGNANRFTPVANYFGKVRARFIRVLPTSWQSHISMRMEVLGDGECYNSAACTTGLGLETKRIADNEITASTTFDDNHGASNARLNRPKQGATTGAWSAKINDQNQWIQADLGVTKLVTGVITQGRNGWTAGQWVTKYNVQYSQDGDSWSYVKNGGQNVEFNGNYNNDSPVRNMLKSPVRARFVRIRPTAWHHHISLRFEILGCDAGPICRNFGLGLQNGRIPDEQITASSEYDVNHGPRLARLNRPQSGSTRGAWSAKTKDANQWIQADFGDVKLVTGVVTQGRNDYSQWVTGFNVQYSVDGKEFKYVQSGEQNVLFKGNTDRYTPVTNMFNPPLRAKIIRIRPTTWQSHPSMRFEVLGCDGIESKSCALGMADGRIRDDQISSSTQHSAPTGPENARLYRPKGLYESGSWSAARNDQNQWLQVDLGHPTVITGLVTQGRSISEPYKQWVTRYFVQYSDDGVYWQYVENTRGGKAVGQMMVKGEKTRSFVYSGYADGYLCQLPANVPLVEECICPIVDCPLCPIPEPCPTCPEPKPCPVPSCPAPPPCPDCPIPACPEILCPPIECPVPEPCPTCPPHAVVPSCPECPINECPEVECPLCPEPEKCPVVDPVVCPECPTEEPSLCPADWVEFNDACYLLVKKRKLNVKRARESCEKKGGYLASYNGAGSEDLPDVKQLQKDNNHKGAVWVDLSKEDGEENFTWSNGLVYQGKGKQAIDTSAGGNCVAFKRSKYASSDCGSNRPYVCRMDILRVLPVEDEVQIE